MQTFELSYQISRNVRFAFNVNVIDWGFFNLFFLNRQKNPYFQPVWIKTEDNRHAFSINLSCIFVSHPS